MRNHARILTAIWADEDFRSLDQAAQHAYLMLLSQPKLSMVGVIDHMPARWAGYTAGVSKAQMERAIATLEAARFVIVDRSEMELLVRTVVKHDPARSWQTRIAMWNAWGAVASDALRAAILRELPPDMWTDEKAPPPTKALALRDAAPHDASDTPSDALSDSDRVLPSPSSFLLPPSPSSYNGSGIGHPQAVDNTTTDDPDPISVHDAGRGVVASLRGAP